MELSLVAENLALLSDQKRLAVIGAVVEARGEGLLVREIAAKAGLTTSVVRTQIKHLESANLLKTKKKGRKIYCFAQMEELRDIVDSIGEVLCPPDPDGSVQPYEFNLETEDVSSPKTGAKKGRKGQYRSLADRLNDVELSTGTHD